MRTGLVEWRRRLLRAVEGGPVRVDRPRVMVPGTMKVAGLEVDLGATERIIGLVGQLNRTHKHG